MGNIGGESGDPLEGLFEAIQHFVKSGGQRRKFGWISLRLDAFMQVR